MFTNLRLLAACSFVFAGWALLRFGRQIIGASDRQAFDQRLSSWLQESAS